jgi:hypothetical protein
VTLAAAPGVRASITQRTAGQAAIAVSLDSGASVVLRGLSLSGFGAGTTGIRIATDGGTVTVDGCEVSGFEVGIRAEDSDKTTRLVLTDTTVEGSTETGLDAAGAVVAVSDSRFQGGRRGLVLTGASATLARVAVTNHISSGLQSDADSTVVVRESTFAGNTTGLDVKGTLDLVGSSVTGGEGVGVLVGSFPTMATLTDTLLSGNGTGVRADGGTAALSGCVVTRNRIGLNVGGGRIETYGNNAVRDNQDDVFGITRGAAFR